jgi:cell wall assembly regulator SMI1
MNTIIKKYDSIFEEDIQQFEKKIVKKLPIEYRNFLLSHNGGIPLKKFFYLNDISYDKIWIDTFISLKKNKDSTVGDLFWVYNIHQELDNFPKRLLPIADDPGGNMICISIGEKDYGYIYYWLHDSSFGEDESDPESYIQYLCDSFEYFINHLEYPRE